MSGNPPNTGEPWVPQSKEEWETVFAAGTLAGMKQYDTERAEWEAKTKPPDGGNDDSNDQPPKRKSLAERLMG